jgi:hypothetical protein
MTSDFDVGLVNPEGRAAHFQMLTHTFIDLRRITLYTTKDSRVIHVKPALPHHLFNITVGKLVVAVPSNAQKNNRRFVEPPFERGLILLQE